MIHAMAMAAVVLPAMLREQLRRPSPVSDHDLEGAQRHGADQVGVRDDAAGARAHGETGEHAGSDRRRPGRHLASRHQQDGVDRPGHCGHERNVDRRKEQAAVEVACGQAEPDRNRSRPASNRHAGDRDERRECGQSRQERHGMSRRERVGQLQRLEEGREDLMPGAVVPEKRLYGLEVRAIGAAARIPGQRLWAIVVGVEFVDGEPVVPRSRKADHQCGGEQPNAHDHVGAHCTSAQPDGPRLRKRIDGIDEQAAVLSLAPDNARERDWCRCR